MSKLKWDVNKVLVIAPKQPATNTWPEEIEKWEHLKDLTYSVAVGSAKQREAAINSDSFITIINRENVVWLVEKFKGKPWPYDCLVIDELSSFKSATSKRFRALKKIRPFLDRVIGLTGTPAPNGYMDLWAECYLLDQGKALGKTLTTYRDIYFKPGRRNGYIVYDWLLKDGAKEKIQERIEPMCVSMQTADYLDLPERLDIVRKFQLSSKAMSLYRKMEKDAFLQVEENNIDAVTAAVLGNKLLQIASGAVYDEDGKAVELHDERLDALDQILEESQDSNVLIFYGFVHEKDRIMARHPEAVDIKEPGAIKAWNEGKIKILLAHPASAGHGLNLQAGGHVSIWFSPTNNLEYYLQAVKRLHRQGQTETVRNFVLLAKDTYDEEVYYRILEPKNRTQSALLDTIKARLAEVRK